MPSTTTTAVFTGTTVLFNDASVAFCDECDCSPYDPTDPPNPDGPRSCIDCKSQSGCAICGTCTPSRLALTFSGITWDGGVTGDLTGPYTVQQVNGCFWQAELDPMPITYAGVTRVIITVERTPTSIITEVIGYIGPFDTVTLFYSETVIDAGCDVDVDQTGQSTYTNIGTGGAVTVTRCPDVPPVCLNNSDDCDDTLVITGLELVDTCATCTGTGLDTWDRRVIRGSPTVWDATDDIGVCASIGVFIEWYNSTTTDVYPSGCGYYLTAVHTGTVICSYYRDADTPSGEYSLVYEECAEEAEGVPETVTVSEVVVDNCAPCLDRPSSLVLRIKDNDPTHTDTTDSFYVPGDYVLTWDGSSYTAVLREDDFGPTSVVLTCTATHWSLEIRYDSVALVCVTYFKSAPGFHTAPPSGFYAFVSSPDCSPSGGLEYWDNYTFEIL